MSLINEGIVPVVPRKIATNKSKVTCATDHGTTELGCSPSNYEIWVKRLYQTNLFNPVNLGLKNMFDIMAHLKITDFFGDDVIVVHVAGSNGKGSTCWKIAKTLRQAGLNVGLFTSPHISSFRERIQINFEPIGEADVEQILPEIYAICEEHDIPGTFFEITTLLAFLYFSRASKVNAVVIEVGLGGRLDATNVIQQPTLSVITSIGLEHTHILGNTIELIAKEKAGIIKHNRPVVIGPCVPYSVVKDIAEDCGSALYTCNEIIGNGEKNNGMDGEQTDFDLENSRVAKASITLLQQLKFINIEENHIQQGIKQRPPCRFEELTVDDVKVILDVAHNPAALDQLMNTMETHYKTYLERKAIRIVIGFSEDKDIEKCANMLLKYVKVQCVHLSEALNARAASVDTILEASPRLKAAQYSVGDRSVTRQVKSALELAAKNDEVLLICGSFFVMGEVRESLGVYDGPRDSEFISAVAGVNAKYSQENFAADRSK